MLYQQWRRHNIRKVCCECWQISGIGGFSDAPPPPSSDYIPLMKQASLPPSKTFSVAVFLRLNVGHLFDWPGTSRSASIRTTARTRRGSGPRRSRPWSSSGSSPSCGRSFRSWVGPSWHWMWKLWSAPSTGCSMILNTSCSPSVMWQLVCWHRSSSKW